MKIKNNIYSIKDLVADDFGPIFEAKNHDVAVRYRDSMVSKNQLNANEFAVFHIGEISENGEIQGVLPRQLTLADLKGVVNEK